ncbi:type I-D CRISPR-associated protein Cas5/Csc1 [Crocosphaera sp.]|uniref:type I-D CRISPR-associated protein Cas5/Csc1 n=1 Tax=Crocosphaera sp. TaxID=2729996 RepID=UPI00261DC2FC|nr:type I-D CRISPR-associated protein Cas5/Csc1 [Crocosphaera sp.]MDJ0581169.1 type I-D CRISPR-associated protein Cas5/Csc1 [Crocosphaera sp.]
MNVYRCQIELHDSLYFATREIGRLYETEPILHNYALCYALGLVDNETYGTTVSEEDSYRYFCSTQIPKYEAHLTKLNEKGIYVTPGRSISHSTVLNTWKYANNNYHVKMEKTQKNIPSFGRTKEIAPESKFECFILSKETLKKDNNNNNWSWKIPKFIRLGKWMSKAEISLEKLEGLQETQGQFTFPYMLNPLDIMFTNKVISYDVINMPPVSLIHNVTMNGKYYKKLNLPVDMEYRFS